MTTINLPVARSTVSPDLQIGKADGINVQPKKLDAAGVDAVLGKKTQRSQDKGGVFNANAPKLDAPKADRTPPSPEDEKKICDEVNQFGLRTAETLLLQVQFALREMRAGAAEMQGKMSIMAESAAHATGESIRRQGFTAGMSTMMQGGVQFGVTAAGVGMKNRAANRDVTNINDNLRKGNALKKEIDFKTNAQQQAFNKPIKNPLDGDMSKPVTTDMGTAIDSKQLVNGNLKPNAKHQAVIGEPLNEMQAKARMFDADYRAEHSKNSRLNARADAVISSGNAMGTVVRTSGQVVEATESMSQEFSRSANRALQETSSQTGESSKNDNNLVQTMQQQLAELQRSRNDANRSVIANIKA